MITKKDASDIRKIEKQKFHKAHSAPFDHSSTHFILQNTPTINQPNR